MKTLTKVLSSLTLGMLLATTVNAAHPKKVSKITPIDPETGLIVAKGVDDVKANCTVCHSAKFITLQRGDRQTWKDMIVWMQKTQGLWEFDAKTEKSILDYLATNYAPDDKIERRKNLPLKYLPKNPYNTTK
jgi:hypothetical protein